MSKLLSEFDLFGTFRLTKDETVGIENLVQELGENEYVSRNWNYYPKEGCPDDGITYFRGICDEYERLNELLPMSGKPAFVVCEKMHELATRVVNAIQQAHKIHLFQDGAHFDTVAQKCAQECADNLVRIINNQTAQKTVTNLRDETNFTPDDLFNRKIVEAENKKQLYMCANALPENFEHLITPGRGASKLSTMIQAVRKHKGLKPLAITQVYYSFYKNKSDKVFTTPLKYLPEKVLVMDDDIDTGRTLLRIKEELTQQGHQVTNGAVIASFRTDDPHMMSNLVFNTGNWADYIDIIPNQFGQYFYQQSTNRLLQSCNGGQIKDVLDVLNYLLENNERHTADYHAMSVAESKAQELGADLYHVSSKISSAAVDYNQKIRAQVEKYDAEFRESLNAK